MERVDKKELLSIYQYVIVLDGLDGSGKKACTTEVANKLPDNTIIVDYPEYSLPWGIFLKHLLHDCDEGLSIHDRMLVYALNRIETVDSLQTQIKQLQTQGQKINLVFNRFFTSNIITAAYYYVKLPFGERPTDLRTWIVDLYKYMQEIDKDFLIALNLQSAVVFVPAINSEESLNGVMTDRTRTQADLYETKPVQVIASRLYEIIAKEFPSQLCFFSQYEKGRRMSPEEQATYLLGLNDCSQTSAVGSHSKLLAELPTKIERINSLLTRFGSKELQKFNPYICKGE